MFDCKTIQLILSVWYGQHSVVIWMFLRKHLIVRRFLCANILQSHKGKKCFLHPAANDSAVSVNLVLPIRALRLLRLLWRRPPHTTAVPVFSEWSVNTG